MAELTRVMREACGSKLVAVTCGEDSSILATENLVSFREKLLKTCGDLRNVLCVFNQFVSSTLFEVSKSWNLFLFDLEDIVRRKEFLFNKNCFVFPPQLVEVPTVRVSSVTDATGAGDAFLGGLVSGW